MRALLSRLLATLRSRQLEDELEEEIQTHLSLLEERFIRGGMDPTEAFYSARRQFGGVEQMKEDLRNRRTLAIDSLTRDMVHAFRRLRRSKRFTASVTLTLALGIGAATAVFAVFYSIILQPLPYATPDRLMAFRTMDSRGTPQPRLLSYADFFDFREQSGGIFDHLVSYRDAPFVLTESSPAIQVPGEIVSWDLFPLLGVQPTLGRGFRQDEEQPGTHVVVLSHTLWESRFGANSEVVGRTIFLNGAAYTVVGVAPEGFHFPVDLPAVQLWVTLGDDASGRDQRGARMLEGLGRLQSGATLQQAQARMDMVAGRLAHDYPDTNHYLTSTWIQPELKRLTGTPETPMVVLVGAVVVLLLITCANVASLLLTRSTERAHEFALRMAIGASRGALVRQQLIESFALGALGTVGGVGLAVGILKALLPLAGDKVPRLAQTTVDLRVLAFAALLAALTSLLFGMAPALQAAAADPADGLRAATRAIASGRDRFRSALVVGQVALGLVLLVGAALLTSSLVSLTRRDPGFRTDHLLTFDIGIPHAGSYSVPQQIAFGDRLIESLRALPGVQAAGAGTPLPLQGHEMRAAFDIEGHPTAKADRPRSDFAIVTPGYFAAMGIPRLQGRDFTAHDSAETLPVLIVNQAFARRFFPGDDAIGKRISSGVGVPPIVMREIVGVVGDAKQAALGTHPDPIYYFPYKQLPWRIGTVTLRTAVPPEQMISAARDILAEMDRHVPLQRARTGDQVAAAVLGPARVLTVLMNGFATMAVLLTVVGLYGVLSYMVARRRREIGVRMALGAGRAGAVGIVLRRAALLLGMGLVLGVTGAYGVGRIATAALAGTSAELLAVVAGACVLMLLTGACAAAVPAARAASVDPMQALHGE
jgi:predicted permease